MSSRVDQARVLEALHENRWFPMTVGEFVTATGLPKQRATDACEALYRASIFALYLRDKGGYCFSDRGLAWWKREGCRAVLGRNVSF